MSIHTVVQPSLSSISDLFNWFIPPVWGFPGGTSGKKKKQENTRLPILETLRDVSLILGQEDPLEEGTVTHSSILAWEILCTKEPGGLQTIKSQRIRHDWSDLAR